MTAEEQARQLVRELPLDSNGHIHRDMRNELAHRIADAIRAAVAEAVTPMPCGHPRVCRVQVENQDGPNHTYCAWCKSLAQEREACAVVAEQLIPVPPTAANQAARYMVRFVATAIRAKD